jgi:hypothetical protein
MGPQTSTDLPTLLRDCEAADAGVMVERRTGELGLDSHTVRENIATSLTLDYTASVIDDIAPTDDDLLTANDWTVTRSGGSSARVEQTDGPMGTDPITGAGRYEKSTTLSLYEDDQAYHAAGWRVCLGTVNGYRYPRLALKLHNSNLAAQADDIAAVDISQRITIQNLPSNLPPDDVELMVEGYTERINNFEWDISFNCAPYSPYNVLTLASPTADTDAGRLSGDEACALRAAIDDNDLSMTVDPNFFRWTEVADDFDPDLKVRLGGEVVEVSGIATTAATYVGRGALSSADNAAVTPTTTGFGATDGDLLLCLGRMYGTAGSLSTASSGWKLIKQVNNLYLWAAIRSSTTPITVTPSGGAAGDVVSATVFALHSMSVTLDDLADLIVTSDTRSNSSAQNIAYGGVYPPRKYPGCVVLLLAGKSDDWTSVAVPAGFTEAGEPSTTTGSDQGLYLAYQIQTTPTVVNEGSLVVTGGASAVSESMILAIPGGYQTFTISARSVNGAAKSHTAGTLIEVADPLVLSL